MTHRPAAVTVALALLACSGTGSTPQAPIVTPVDAPRVAAPPWSGDPLPKATLRLPPEDLPAPAVDLLVRAGDLVAGGAEVEVIVWDRDGRELRRVPAADLGALAISAAGLVAIAADGAIRVVDPRSGEERLRLEGSASDVGLTEDGALLAIGSDEGVRLVDVATGEVVRTIVPDYGADAVGFAPDGRTIYSSDAFAHHAWDVATGVEIARFGGGFGSEFKVREGVLWVFLDGVDPPQRYDAASYARIEDLTLGDLVYTGDLDADRLVLDAYATDPSTKRRVRLMAGDVEDVVLPKDGEVWFATGLTIERWRDLPDVKLVDGPVRVPRADEPGGGNAIGGAAWTAEGLSVAIQGPFVRTYGAAGPTDVKVPCAGEGYDCEISELVAAGDGLEITLYDDSVWRVEGGRAADTRRKATPDDDFEPAPLIAPGNVRLHWNRDGIAARDVAGSELFVVQAIGGIGDVALSPDGRWLAVADTALRLVDVEAGREVAQVVFSEDYGVDHVAWSPDGLELAAVQRWETGDHVWKLPLGALAK